MLMFDIVKACKIGDCALRAGHGRGWLGIEGWALDIDRRFIPDRDMAVQVAERAQIEFFQKNLQSTKGRNAVLVFVSVFERQVVILGDQGIHKILGQEGWDKEVQHLISGFKSGQAKQGFLRVIEDLGSVLSQHFPAQKDNQNELCNQLIIKD